MIQEIFPFLPIIKWGHPTIEIYTSICKTINREAKYYVELQAVLAQVQIVLVLEKVSF